MFLIGQWLLTFRNEQHTMDQGGRSRLKEALCGSLCLHIILYPEEGEIYGVQVTSHDL
jgi:hypothetical protein